MYVVFPPMNPTAEARTLQKLLKHVVRISIVLVAGGFLGATLARFAPGYSSDEEELDSRLSHESIAALRQNPDDSSNLASFYLNYWNKLLHGDLGVSRTLHEPVSRLLNERFPETLKSVGCGLTVGWALGLSMAVIAALAPVGSLRIGTTLLATVLLCIPAAVLALLFVIVQAPPRLAIGLIILPRIFQFARNLLERTASLPHVLAARAKGLGEMRVLLWHIFPVAAPPLLALTSVSVCLAFAAAIPVEALCDLPGIGQLAWRAALSRDLPLLVNLTVLVTLMTLLANSLGEWAAQPLRTDKA